MRAAGDGSKFLRPARSASIISVSIKARRRAIDGNFSFASSAAKALAAPINNPLGRAVIDLTRGCPSNSDTDAMHTIRPALRRRIIGIGQRVQHIIKNRQIGAPHQIQSSSVKRRNALSRVSPAFSTAHRNMCRLLRCRPFRISRQASRSDTSNCNTRAFLPNADFFRDSFRSSRRLRQWTTISKPSCAKPKRDFADTAVRPCNQNSFTHDVFSLYDRPSGSLSFQTAL